MHHLHARGGCPPPPRLPGTSGLVGMAGLRGRTCVRAQWSLLRGCPLSCAGGLQVLLTCEVSWLSGGELNQGSDYPAGGAHALTPLAPWRAGGAAGCTRVHGPPTPPPWGHACCPAPRLATPADGVGPCAFFRFSLGAAWGWPTWAAAVVLGPRHCCSGVRPPAPRTPAV